MSDTLEPTRWRRLNKTPLRDLIRGRVTGRLDLDARLARAGLPEPVQQLVRRIVRRTRLWPLEKTDVADELIAHFHDGLEAGVTADELIASFGDEKQAAKLIRRAKRRQRPLAWHVLNGSLMALGVFLLIYGAATLVIFLREPDVSVDYLAVMNKVAAAVPEEDRAWPIYREALLHHGLRDIELDTLYRGSVTDSALKRPGDPEWQASASFLREHAALLDVIRRGAARPGLGFQVGHGWEISEEDRVALELDAPTPPSAPDRTMDRLAEESLLSVLLPHLQHLRNMARLMSADLHLAAAEQDAARALNDLSAILGLARHARENPTLIADLVAHSIIAMGLHEFAHVLAEQPELFSREQLVAIAHRLAPLDAYREPNLGGERMWFRDVLQRIYDDDGRLTYSGLRFLQQMDLAYPRHTPDQVAVFLLATLPLTAALIAPRDEMAGEYDRLMDMAQVHASLPLWEQLQATNGVDERVMEWASSPIGRIRYWPLVYLVPAVERSGERTRETIAHRDALLAAVALELYRRDHGGYPPTLHALVPQYLPSPAVDHSTGKPLLYRVVNERPLLYGRGLDGDDDLGVATAEAASRWHTPPKDGDWVLYPPPTADQ